MRSIGPGVVYETSGAGSSLCNFLVVIRKMVKPMLGLAARVLLKVNCQEGPINPLRVRDTKSRNITPV